MRRTLRERESAVLAAAAVREKTEPSVAELGRKSKESRGTGKNRKLEEGREPGEGHRPRENRGTGGRKRGYELYPIIKELFSRGRERPRLYDDRRRRGGV